LPSLTGTRVQLDAEWTIGEALDRGGFGLVFTATGEDGTDAVAKFVPKAPGAERELLFMGLGEGEVRNVVPILDSGEHAENFVLVMPRAQLSLQHRLREAGEPLDLDEVIGVLRDVATALTDLAAHDIVHRDLKPPNVLLLDGSWCLADFGIARYAEATTAQHTWKLYGSQPYMAPERWRAERATSAADVYALGVMAYEMLEGGYPFRASEEGRWREAHLHGEVPPLEGGPAALAALVEECLLKAPEARPSPSNIVKRLERLTEPASPGLRSLMDAHRAEVARQADATRLQAEARTEQERRAALAGAAMERLVRLTTDFAEAIAEAAPATKVAQGRTGRWDADRFLLELTLGAAKLEIAAPSSHSPEGDAAWQLPFDVVASSTISLRQHVDSDRYAGRAHSLWYCDAQEPNEYAWYETAFVDFALGAIRTQRTMVPFALAPDDEDAAKALSNAVTGTQVAWPFETLVVGDLGEFIDRWGGWFASAAERGLQHPSTLPERTAQGSWRR
jgi:eukaryotic-like serine/threonine-protein kinase